MVRRGLQSPPLPERERPPDSWHGRDGLLGQAGKVRQGQGEGGEQVPRRLLE